MATASAQIEPASRPSRIADHGTMNAQAGVMATRPATAPDAAPTVVGWPSRIFSTSSQPRTPAAVATWVLVKASAAVWLAARAEPGVEPEPAEPQQARTEQDGRHVVRPERGLGPAVASSEDDRQGQASSTGVDVDRSTSCEVLNTQPREPAFAGRRDVHRSRRPSARRGSTRCVTQNVTKMPQLRNFARSAMAPEISAGVMMANISWNIEKASAGIG